MNDLIRLAAEQAAERFGSEGYGDGTFNAASFSNVLSRLAGLPDAKLDGLMVRAILTGRPDIDLLPSGFHFRVKR